MDKLYIEQMQTHLDEGGKLTHINAVELFNENKDLRTQNAELVKALEEIREIYAGMDGFYPLTAPEAYQDKKLKEIWELARKALAKAKKDEQ